MHNRSPEKSQIPGEGVKTRKWRLAWEHPAVEPPAEAGVRGLGKIGSSYQDSSQWNPCRSVTTQVVNHGYFQMFKS